MQISEQLGRITVLQPQSITPHLRKENRIRTIHSSLAIEHNSLTKEQVTAIINGKRVLGNPNEIKEAEAAFMDREMRSLQKQFEQEKKKLHLQFVAEEGSYV